MAQVLLVDTCTDSDCIHHIGSEQRWPKERKDYYSTDNVTTRMYLSMQASEHNGDQIFTSPFLRAVPTMKAAEACTQAMVAIREAKVATHNFNTIQGEFQHIIYGVCFSLP